LLEATTGAPLAAAAMANVTQAVPAPAALVADNDTLPVAAVVGVPEIRPVVAFRVSPAGSVVAV
jgi:hypothetical protein